LAKGPLAEYPVVGVHVILEDGSYHEVDSSDLAFQICARNCFVQMLPKMRPVLLEPVMKLEADCPVDFQGAVTGDLVSRRGSIVSTDLVGNIATVGAEVPLAETFGYATDLRSLTQGQGTFTMQPLAYRKVPATIQEAIVAQRRENRKGELVGTG
jgi:elongation factor G